MDVGDARATLLLRKISMVGMSFQIGLFNASQSCCGQTEKDQSIRQQERRDCLKAIKTR